MPTPAPQQMTTSDFNLEKLNTKDLSAHIKAAIDVGSNIAIFGRRGTGKMLDLETELPTPSGFTKLKDLKEGDALFDEKGEICHVTQLHLINLIPKSYQMVFDDGTIVNACADHLWLTWDKAARRSFSESENPEILPQVRSTQDILDTLKYIGSKTETNHSIRNSCALRLPNQNLLIDPYVLGCWLGDGRTDSGSIECADGEILNEFRKVGYSVNLTSNVNSKSKSSNYRIVDRVANDGKSTIGLLKKQLKQLGLIGNKHIPDIYLRSSFEQRLSLLQGLMDTDGTCDKTNHQLEFCSILPQLANQVLELANSLGIKAKLHVNESFLYGTQHKDRYRVSFITKLPVFRLERKLNNLKKTTAQDNRNNHRYIVDIKPIDSLPMRCITVDSPSHLYLITRSFIPTHNTEISKQEIKKANLHEVYINLSVLERVDLGGYPNIMGSRANEKFVDFLLPKFYEPMFEGTRNVVALLDEVDKADPSLWAPLLEFTQFKSINGRSLPKLAAVIMTGNLISEGGARPSLPLLDRSEKYLVEADATSWLEWAGKSNHIHPSVTAYINDHPKDLFGAVDPDDRYADPSPRGWQRASQLLYAGEKLGWSTAMLNKKVCGCVGKDAGLKYSNYYEYYQELLPMVEEIYQGKDVSAKYDPMEPGKKLVACMITCARLATHLDSANENEPPPAVRFVGRFLQKASYENVLVAVRSQIQIDRLVKFNLDEHPEWEQVLNRINKSVDE